MIEEINHTLQLADLQSPHVEEWVLMLPDFLEHPLEEGAAGRKDHLVAVHLPILTCQGDISKVLVLPQIAEGSLDILLEIVPFQAKFVVCIHLG